MSDSWINHLPVATQERIRKRLRSPEVYAETREKVKGPEDLEREMEKNEAMAELKYGLEIEPDLHEALKTQIEKDCTNMGFEQILSSEMIPDGTKNMVKEGTFHLQVSSHPGTHEDVLFIIPEGNIQEKLSIRPAQTEKYLAQFINWDTQMSPIAK